MIVNRLIRERLKHPRVPSDLLSIFGPRRMDCAPVYGASRGIARLAILPFPAYRVNVLATAKQTPKKSNLLFSCGRHSDVGV
jgi:hypothetical protein